MTEFEKERDEAAKKFNSDTYHINMTLGPQVNVREYSFQQGADWANARAEKKVQGLVEALEYIGERMIAGVAGMYGDEALSPEQDCYEMQGEFIEVYKKALAEYRGEK